MNYEVKVSSNIIVSQRGIFNIQKSETEFEIELKELPTYVGLDPYHTRLDKNVEDNISILQKP